MSRMNTFKRTESNVSTNSKMSPLSKVKQAIRNRRFSKENNSKSELNKQNFREAKDIKYEYPRRIIKRYVMPWAAVRF